MDIWHCHNMPRKIKGHFKRLNDPVLSYHLLATKQIKDDEIILAEASVSSSPKYSYYYARDIFKNKFPAGEAAIAKDPPI